MNPGRVLVLQLARLGDLVQTWPLLRRVKAAWPGTRLEVLCEAGLVPLCPLGPPLEGAHGLDLGELAVLSRQKPATAGRRLQAFLGEMRRRGFGLLVNLNLSRLSLLLTHALAAPVLGYVPLAGGREFGRPPWLAYVLALVHLRRLNRVHVSDIFRHLAPQVPAEPFPAAARTHVAAEPRVGLVLATRHPKRTWPPAAFARLVSFLAEKTEARFVLLGTRQDRPLGETLLRGLPRIFRARVRNLLGETGLAELAGELRGLSLLISGDTGTLHLAAALGVPCLGLFFGPAQAWETGPYGAGHLVLQAEPPCHPCREADPCEETQCLRLLTPELAAQVAAARLAGEPLLGATLPPQVRLYETGRDFLGASLSCGARQPPTLSEVVAWAYRHLAGRLLGLEPPLSSDPELPPELRPSLERLAQAARGKTPALPACEAELLRPLQAFRAEAARQGALQGRPEAWRELVQVLQEDFARCLEQWAA